jgi:predicted nucleic acid-binding protein
LKQTLIDTGPLVALFDRSERWHSWVADQLSRIAPPLLTCEAVLAEAVYLLRSTGDSGLGVLRLVDSHVLKVALRIDDECGAVSTLMARYAPQMDLADGCMVRLSELHRDCVLLTFDSDYRHYRRFGRSVIPVAMPSS